MKNLNVQVNSDGSISCHFILQDTDGNKQIARNVKEASFTIQDGMKYGLVALVHGDAGTKYKLVISGATKASYPKKELSIEADGRDELIARITG